MTFSTETKDIFSALAQAQASIEGAVKDKINPAFKSKYADLSSVIDAARGPLKANGLAVIEDVRQRDLLLIDAVARLERQFFAECEARAQADAGGRA